MVIWLNPSPSTNHGVYLWMTPCPLSVFMKGWLIWFDFDLNLIAQRDRSDGTRPKKKQGGVSCCIEQVTVLPAFFGHPNLDVHSFWAITIFLEFAAHLTLDFVARPLSCHLLGQLTTVTRSTTKEMSRIPYWFIAKFCLIKTSSIFKKFKAMKENILKLNFWKFKKNSKKFY